jgi:hypothetical protein
LSICSLSEGEANINPKSNPECTHMSTSIFQRQWTLARIVMLQNLALVQYILVFYMTFRAPLDSIIPPQSPLIPSNPLGEWLIQMSPYDDLINFVAFSLFFYILFPIEIYNRTLSTQSQYCSQTKSQ